MFALWFGLVGCYLQPVVFDDALHEAPGTRATFLGVRGIADPRFYGESRTTIRHLNGPGYRRVRTVVVPLLEPGQTLPEAEVHVWLTHDRLIDEDIQPSNEPFFEAARERFDGVHLNVLQRRNTIPEAGWNRAVRDAVERHGLRSHPDAVVIGLKDNGEPCER